MSIPNHADLYDYNIQKSVEKWVRAQTDFMAYYPNAIVFEDTQFNPENMTRWIKFEWVSMSGKVYSLNTFHVRCFSRPADDRFGRKLELMVGRVQNLFSQSLAGNGITFYDIMNQGSAVSPDTIDYDGEALKIAIRPVDRSPRMDASEMGETIATVRGVNLVVLTYNAHVARPSAQW